MRKPNAFVVGAPKCGTTALSQFLREHPQVFFSTPKELHYFNRDTPREFRRRALEGLALETDDAYLRMFEEAGPQHRVLAEGSVLYLSSAVALAAIARFNPEARIIVMLRNPVEMAVSLHAGLLYSFQEEVRDFAAAWALQGDRRRGLALPRRCLVPFLLQYRSVCSLASQLEHAFSVFGRDRCLPIVHDDFLADPAGVWRRVEAFLGLDPDGRRVFPRVNDRSTHRARALGLLLMRPPFWLHSMARALKRLTGLRSLGVRPLGLHFGVVKAPRPELPASLRATLAAAFEDEIAKLEALLGRDLACWRRVDAAYTRDEH